MGKELEKYQEMLDEMDAMFLNSFKTDWLEEITYYIIQFGFQVIFSIALYLAFTTKHTPLSWQYMIIYATVTYAFMMNLLKTIEMVVKDIQHHKYYKKVKQRYNKTHPLNKAIIVDEGGISGK